MEPTINNFFKEILGLFHYELSNNLPDVSSIEKGTSAKTIKIKSNKKDRTGKVISKEIKLGKFFKKLFPDFHDKQIGQLVTDYKKHLYHTYTFTVEDDVPKFFNPGCRRGSCMNDKEYITVFYNQTDSNMIVLHDEGEPVGSAILWNNVEGIDKKFMDRIYPVGDFNIVTAMKEFALKNGYEYRGTERTQKENHSVMKISIPNYDTGIRVPYMDTFSYGKYDVESGTLIISNHNMDALEFNNLDGTRVGETYSDGDDVDTEEEMYSDRGLSLGNIRARAVQVYDYLNVISMRIDGNVRVEGEVTAKGDIQCEDIEAGYITANTISAENVSCMDIHCIETITIYGDLNSDDVVSKAGDLMVGGDIDVQRIQCKDIEAGYITANTISAKNIQTVFDIEALKSITCHNVDARDVLCSTFKGNSISASGEIYCASRLDVTEDIIEFETIKAPNADIYCRNIESEDGVITEFENIVANGHINCKTIDSSNGSVSCKSIKCDSFKGYFYEGKWLNRNAKFEGSIYDPETEDFILSNENPIIFWEKRKKSK